MVGKNKKKSIFFGIETLSEKDKNQKESKTVLYQQLRKERRRKGTLEFLKKYGAFLNFEAQLTQVSEQVSF